MPRRYLLVAWLAAMLVGSALRLIFMPSSTGPDPIQFYSFGRLLLKYGWDFYSSAADTMPPPFGWKYPYPPLWGAYLALIALIYGPKPPYKAWWVGSNYRVVVDPAWVALVKIPLLISDLLIAVSLLWFFRRSGRGVLASVLWYLSPMSIYISSIFGMFDTLATLFLVLGLGLVKRGRIRLGGALMGLSLMVKQHVVFAILPALIYLLGRDRRKAGALFAWTAATSLALFSPFILLSHDPWRSVTGIVSALTYSGSPYYPLPLCYSFNGLFSLLTYTHLAYGLDTLWVFRLWPILWAALFAPPAYQAFRGKIGLPEASMLGYTSFLASFWRVNHQYLIPLIALASIVIATRGARRSVLEVTLYNLSWVWVALFPTAFWFWVYMPTKNTPIRNIMETLSLHVFGDLNYTIFSLALWTAELVTLARGALPPRPPPRRL